MSRTIEPKWKNNADAPVLFFIDDLANKWIDLNNDGQIQPEEDWGYAGFDKNGVFAFLKSKILDINPEIKITFFVTVGKRAPVIEFSHFGGESHAINYNEKSKLFFKTIATNPRYELAYHGTTHGLPGNQAKDFRQEWDSFVSLHDAIASIKKGREIFKGVVGQYPLGGKYSGYISNSFSDESIDKSGFKWWCRYCNSSAVEGSKRTNYSGTDSNPLTAFQFKVFGKNKLIDIPTTIPGNLLDSIFNPSEGMKGILKKILMPFIIKWRLRKIAFLIKRNLIISIQEHISPAREDGKRQSPNIFDDLEGLLAIFKYLEKKNVWYCTGSELAEWISENRNT